MEKNKEILKNFKRPWSLPRVVVEGPQDDPEKNYRLMGFYSKGTEFSPEYNSKKYIPNLIT
ncbi:MAG: hypothetical protein JNJ47_01420 [Alphaproteobacteria bacterium]|nr:hypothetical protein [Alphaproteobacteria bacterium]